MVRLIFCDSGQLGTGLIKLMTWSEWPHVGIMLPNDDIIDSRWSNHGVRQNAYADVVPHLKHYAIREFPLAPDKVMDIVASQIGKPYDLTPLLGIPFRRNWQEDDKWFCSELIAWAFAQANYPLVNKETWRITPQDLWQAVR